VEFNLRGMIVLTTEAAKLCDILTPATEAPSSCFHRTQLFVHASMSTQVLASFVVSLG